MIWTRVNYTPPPKGVFVNTKIDDENGCRNECLLKFENNLWWDNSGMYVYYTPTHWSLNN